MSDHRYGGQQGRQGVSTIERAYQLARSGEFASVSDIKARLNAEGYPDVAGQLYGPTMTKDLRRLCLEAKGLEATG